MLKLNLLHKENSCDSNLISNGVTISYDDIFAPVERKEYTAFTLAEVLITLGIIGVVAALTMPMLQTKVQELILEAQAKKAKNVVANGYKLMMAHYEIFDVANLPFLTKCDDMSDKECVSREHKDAFSVVNDSTNGLTPDTMPDEYAVVGKEDPSLFKWDDVPYMFTTGDGMIFGVIPDENYASFDVVVDVNGKNNPNIAVKDLLKFRFQGDGGQLYDVSSELADVTPECSSENKSACTTSEDCRNAGGSWLSISWSPDGGTVYSCF